MCKKSRLKSTNESWRDKALKLEAQHLAIPLHSPIDVAAGNVLQAIQAKIFDAKAITDLLNEANRNPIKPVSDASRTNLITASGFLLQDSQQIRRDPLPSLQRLAALLIVN